MGMCCVQCIDKGITIPNYCQNSSQLIDQEISLNQMNVHDELSKLKEKPIITSLRLNNNKQNDKVQSFSKTSIIQLNTSEALNIQTLVTSFNKPFSISLSNSIIGLYNLGNSCFMNSSLQILIHCYPFLKTFDKEIITQEQTISIAFKELIYQMYSCNSTKKKIVPKNFKKIFETINTSFANHTQQDCQEFLNTFLENINSEHNRIINKLPYKQLPQIGKKTELYKEFVDYFNKKESSIITDVFYWNDLSLLTCSCGNQLHVFNRKTDLPLHLLKENLKPHVTQLIKDRYTQSKTVKFLSECIECNKSKESQESHSICSLPQVLILSLQRNNGEDSIKNRIGVEFDEEIDLREVVDKEIFDEDQETCFCLYGLVLHVGNIECGHYISNIKINNQWTMFDDDRIKTLPLEANRPRYKSKDVYCLFYLRKDQVLQDKDKDKENISVRSNVSNRDIKTDDKSSNEGKATK